MVTLISLKHFNHRVALLGGLGPDGFRLEWWDTPNIPRILSWKKRRIPKHQPKPRSSHYIGDLWRILANMETTSQICTNVYISQTYTPISTQVVWWFVNIYCNVSWSLIIVVLSIWFYWGSLESIGVHVWCLRFNISHPKKAARYYPMAIHLKSSQDHRASPVLQQRDRHPVQLQPLEAVRGSCATTRDTCGGSDWK